MKKLLIFLAFVVLSTLTVPGQSAEDVFGNPDKATADAARTPDKLLVKHPNYTLSYNRSRGASNWVMWHLDNKNFGDADRKNKFIVDPLLPADFQINKKDYSNSGLDKGHMCPSEDRTDQQKNNDETFLMSNMQAQTHSLNAGVWKSLESYAQKKTRKEGFEAYIIAGCYGSKGTIGNKGRVTIPERCFKIVILLKLGENDLERIDKDTRIIAVDMPNEKPVKKGWQNHVVTVDDLERKLGFDFLAPLANNVENALESKKDPGP